MEQKAKSLLPIRYYKGDTPPQTAKKEYVNTKLTKEYLGKCTKVDTGNKKYGGWTQEGLLFYKKLVNENKIASSKITTAMLEKEILLFYKELVMENKIAHSKPTTAPLEQEILNMICKNHKITGNTYEEFKQHLKGDKQPAVELQEVEGLIDMDDFDNIVAI